jgi:prepilin-type N-terminal cleavage/methylation domain-containing protein
MRRAFSLVELLVVIGVLAVLISLALPALKAVRLQGLKLKSLSNLSQIGKTTELYSIEYGTYFFGVQGLTRPNQSENQGGVSFPIWSLSLNWPLLAHRVAPWESHYETWVSPRGDTEPMQRLIRGEETRSVIPISYHFSNSFVAKPVVWSIDAGREASDDHISSVQPHMVTYPSSKVIFFDAYRPYLNRDAVFEDPRPVLFSDGSVKAVFDVDATDPTLNRLRDNYVPYRYHDTPNGVNGRDF